MSQRSEKQRRRIDDLENRISSLECYRIFYEALESVRSRDAEEERKQAAYKYRRRLEEQKKQKEQVVLFAVVTCLFVLLLSVLTVTARSAQAERMQETADKVPVTTVDEPTEDHENQYIEEALLARANKLENVKITHYCAERYAHICGTGDGITASGVLATPYVSVAVDPGIIPLGSEVMIDYGDGDIQYCRADDIGGGVHGAHVDVCVAGHQEALALGVKTATVHWIAPA